jgi:hypothetical protein
LAEPPTDGVQVSGGDRFLVGRARRAHNLFRTKNRVGTLHIWTEGKIKGDSRVDESLIWTSKMVVCERADEVAEYGGFILRWSLALRV